MVEHPSGIQVLKISDEFVDIDIAPLATSSSDPDAEWSDADSDAIRAVYEAVVGIDVEMKINTCQTVSPCHPP